MRNREYTTCLHLTERPCRLDAFVNEIAAVVDDQQYGELLAEIWIDTEYPYAAFNTWQQLFASKRPGRENLMNDEERAALSALPSTLAIYRGGWTNKGLSWTLSEDQARRFVVRFGGDRKSKMFKGTVAKDKVYAYRNRRNEQEIVVDPKFVTVE